MELKERKAKQSIRMLAEAELGKKSHVDEWKTRNLKRHQKISKAERKIMCSPRRDERETAPKASPVKEERNCVLKKKKQKKLVSHVDSLRTKNLSCILFHTC